MVRATHVQIVTTGRVINEFFIIMTTYLYRLFFND